MLEVAKTVYTGVLVLAVMVVIYVNLCLKLSEELAQRLGQTERKDNEKVSLLSSGPGGG